MYNSFNEALKNRHIANINKYKYYPSANFVLCITKPIMGSFSKLINFSISVTLPNSYFLNLPLLQSHKHSYQTNHKPKING